jgi:hypothetical protein
MIAVARSWQEPERLEAGAGSRAPGTGRGFGRPVVRNTGAAEGEGRAALRAVAAPERALQLPLIPEDEIPARATGPDRPPELTHYRDEGCRFWHACLSCPFPRCLYEEPGGAARALNAYRDGEIRRMFAAGRPAVEIAEEFGLTRGSVYGFVGPGARRGRGNGQAATGNRERSGRSRSHVPRRGRSPLSIAACPVPRD